MTPHLFKPSLRSAAVAIAVACLAATASPSAADESGWVVLRLNHRAGQVLRVEEEILDSYTKIEKKNRKVIWRNDERLGLSADFLEETLTLEPYLIKRSYERAEWTEGRGRKRSSNLDETRPSSVSGQTLTYGTQQGLKLAPGDTQQGLKPEQKKIDAREVDTLLFFCRLCPALLPGDMIQVKEDWKLEGSGLVRAFCGPEQAPSSAAAQGRGTLKSIKVKGGRTVAQLAFEIQIKRLAGVNQASLDMKLQGLADLDVEAGVFLKIHLEGRYTTARKSDRATHGDSGPLIKIKHVYTVSTTGRRTFTYSSEVVTPGRDGEAAPSDEDESP